MNFLFVILLSAVIILQAWNLVTLRQMRRQGSSPITDPQYNELKYKQEFMVAVVALIASALGYFGFSSWKDSQETLNKEVAKAKAIMQKNSSEAIATGRELEELKKLDVLQESYIVSDLFYRSYEDRDPKPKRMYFKNMKTIRGKTLPVFKKTPKIFLYGSAGVMYITKTTPDYIDVVSYFHTSNESTKPYIDLPVAIMIIP